VPVEAVLGLIVVAVVANLLLMAALIYPSFAGRARRKNGTATVDPAADARMTEAAVVSGLIGDPLDPDARPAYDRVVRIVSWVFLMATATIVAVTGLWPATQAAILVLLALAGLFVIVVHDLLPSEALGPGRFVVEGSVALTAATFLVALTGGVQSPFFFTFPLIVAGAALVVSSSVTVGLTVVAALGYLTGVLAGSPPNSMGPMAGAVIGVNLTALILLAYVAMVIAREQRRTRDAAIRLSTIDPLTGLFNRTFFFAAIEREITRSARSGRGFCLLMMDLDELKAVNDRFGHFHGDRVLHGVGEVIASGVRKLDTAARYGGDEFVVLLPETDPTGAFVLAEKIRLGVKGMQLGLPPGSPQPSLSVGVVSFPDDGRSVDELMISADGAMYASKRAGKDRVTGIPMPLERT
jgi:diguanylate cyclase (GGDEF)-like protein